MWDCVVVGGGAAGLSAGLVLGRARRRTLVVDAGEPSNRFAHGIGGLLGHDGRPPAELYSAARDELAGYPSVELRSGAVVGGAREEPGFELELDDGSRERALTVLLATGMDYRHPELEGIAERWGRSVFHCPFCHGWEVRDRRLGVLDRGENGARRALMLRNWSERVTLLAGGPAELEADDARRLEAAGVAVDERPVSGLLGAAPDLTGIAFADGSELPCEGLLVPVTLHQRSDLGARLGAATTERPPLIADAIEVDAKFATSVSGLYAAGDASGQMQSVANAVAAGSVAAAMIVHDLPVSR
jgi:thioredoxin reductase